MIFSSENQLRHVVSQYAEHYTPSGLIKASAAPIEPTEEVTVAAKSALAAYSSNTTTKLRS